MKNAQDGTADRRLSGTDGHPERPLIVSILREIGMQDCFSMAWLLDRFDQQEKPT